MGQVCGGRRELCMQLVLLTILLEQLPACLPPKSRNCFSKISKLHSSSVCFLFVNLSISVCVFCDVGSIYYYMVQNMIFLWLEMLIFECAPARKELWHMLPDH